MDTSGTVEAGPIEASTSQSRLEPSLTITAGVDFTGGFNFDEELVEF
jgi:hypothetical protein